jgi:hypothetical protein
MKEMAIYPAVIPYMVATPKRIALPKDEASLYKEPTPDMSRRFGFGNIIFPFTENVTNTIKIMNNTKNCYPDGKYRYYYYNLYYKGKIGAKRYYIRNVKTRKEVYARVAKESKVGPHPPSLLSATPNRNTFYEMSKYFEIFKSLTASYSYQKKMQLFWVYFKSIWFSDLTKDYPNKIVLIDADQYDRFSNNLKTAIDNPLFMLYYTMYKKFEYIEDLDIEFLIFCNNMVLRVNPSKCTAKSHIVFKRELNKLFAKKTKFSEINENELDKVDQVETIKESLSKKYNMTGDTSAQEEITDQTLNKSTEKKTVAKSTDVEKKPQPKKSTTTQQKKSTATTKTPPKTEAVKKAEQEEVKKAVEKKIDESIEKSRKEMSEIVPDKDITTPEMTQAIQTKVEMDIDSDKELINKMYQVMQDTKLPTKPVSSARDEAMRKKQEELKVGTMTVKELSAINAAKKEIPKKDVSKSLHTINDNMKTVKFSNMNRDYIENVMPSDIMNMFTCLNEKSSKFYVQNVAVEDTSNELNYKETWKVTLVDEQKKQHIITVDIPKFLDNKFMYLGGNKKIINKQNFLYPVVKTAPDTVQIVTNYNKMFIRRIGSKSISAVERMTKLIASTNESYKYFTMGNNSSVNKSYLTTIEYDEFAKVLTQFKSERATIFFNQKYANDYADAHDIEIPQNHIFIGYVNGENIFLDADTQLTNSGLSICDLIYTELPQQMQQSFGKTRSTKKLMYDTVTIMSQSIPFIVLLMYWEGISTVFKKIGLKYRFSTKYPSSLKSNESVIRFKDSYFVYEEDLATSLLMNGIRVLDTENYNMQDYNSAEPYLPYFKKVYGKVSIVNALSNAYDFSIDPITKEILNDANLPTDLVELCIYASSLLADESYTIENSQTLSRVRSTEIIPAILYDEISTAYIQYKNSAGKKKLSIPKDAVIKQLLKLQTVEDYSTLNPVVELEKDRAITSKGFRGINVERAYTEEKRSYDASMIGVQAMSTSPDGNCGINRFLTLEPNITTARGYVDIKENDKESLKDVNLFSASELLYPLGNTRDDSIRTAMAKRQSGHVIPVQNSSPALITNGADEAIRFDLSTDFVVNAEDDGVVVDYDDKSKIMMIEYKNGKHQAVNLAPQVVKNGGGGFFLNNQLETTFKVGDKVKKDEPIAYHKDFFTNDPVNGVRMNVGVLEKVCIASSYDTYNDSTAVTYKLSKDATANMTFCKSVVIGKNSNVYNIKKVGDSVNIGDSLIDFDTSFDDTDLNKLLAHLSDENKQTLEETSMNSVKSKYAGHIVDIKIYSTVDTGELSPSLQKIVKSYYARVNNKNNFVSKYDKSKSIVKCGLLLNETTGKVEPNIYGVIKGQKVEDSVLIEFYIEHGDIMGVGDKLAYFTALKSIIGEVIPEGYEPYSEFRPNEEISSIISPSAILKRQVPSIMLTVLGNKVIVELKRKLEDIYRS